MSQENVELAERLMPPDVDFAVLFRDDGSWAAVAGLLASCTTTDFEVVARGGPEGEVRHPGLDGFRSFFLDWYAPWATYRHEIDRAIDLDDRVLVLKRDSARFADSEQHVTLNPGFVLTFRAGKIARWETYLDRAEALRAVGLEE
jgi:ketosteroid isomerase-like protein